MVINNKFNIGDFVYLKHDPEQIRMMITSIKVSPMEIMYMVSSGMNESPFYEMELSNDLCAFTKLNLNQ